MVFRLGGEAAAMTLYNEAFAEVLEEVPGGEEGGTRGHEEVLLKWQDRVLRAVGLSTPLPEGRPDQLVDSTSGEVILDRVMLLLLLTPYCHVHVYDC